ncbi:transmembrane protein 218-like protein [Leptotrombidium deliense]|uniref:Transmembrane protein 218-like protein n=1 Tax=Leptotrombidium deliense TaxID=299467 RepID=A0A443S388_9ACAR|nr:transmembrane protein 218-like protein [Leptotrombidium deliense]
MSESSARVFELGIGLFLLCLLWAFAFIVCLLTNRVKSKAASLGPLVVAVVTLISIILLFLPRERVVQEEYANKTVHYVEKHMNRNFENVTLPANWMNVWRVLILIVNIIALIVGLSIVYIKWLSKRIRRPKWSVVLQNSKAVDGE